MTLNVLRSTNEDGQEEMMKLVRYNVGQAAAGTNNKDIGSLIDASTNSGQ